MPLNHIVNHLSNNHRHILFFSKQPIEKSIDWENKIEFLEELKRRLTTIEDARAHRNFQIQDLYSTFQVTPQQEEPTDSDESRECWTKRLHSPFI